MHLDEGRLQRLVHGELSRSEERVAREHLSGCDECRRRSLEAEREEAEVDALLRELDSPTPPAEVAEIVDRARVRRPQPLRWVAGLILATAVGGVAYAIPGSPLPQWIDAIASWVGIAGEPSSTTPSPQPTSESSEAGIAVTPGRQLLILFEFPHARERIRVSLTDDDEVVLRAPAGAATFTSETARLVVANRDSTATFDVQIPRAAPRVEIQVAGSRIFLKESPRLIP